MHNLDLENIVLQLMLSMFLCPWFKSIYMNENKRLYCAFVDMKKAFDSVYIHGLWFYEYLKICMKKLNRVLNIVVHIQIFSIVLSVSDKGK